MGKITLGPEDTILSIEHYIVVRDSGLTMQQIPKSFHLKARVYCEDCEYETDFMTMKDIIYKVSMEGGYIQSDKAGGYFSKCPKCGHEHLTIESN